MIQQIEFSLKPRRRGFHLITEEVMSHLSALPATGLVNLFVKHTSCALSINENLILQCVVIWNRFIIV